MSSIRHHQVSNTRHLQLHYPLFETERHGLVIVNFPDPFCGIPFAARLFDTALQFGFPEFHSQSDNLRLFRRRPVGFFDDDFDSREAFPPLIVIAIADPRSAACHTVRGTSSCLSDLESMSAEPA